MTAVLRARIAAVAAMTRARWRAIQVGSATMPAAPKKRVSSTTHIEETSARICVVKAELSRNISVTRRRGRATGRRRGRTRRSRAGDDAQDDDELVVAFERERSEGPIRNVVEQKVKHQDLDARQDKGSADVFDRRPRLAAARQRGDQGGQRQSGVFFPSR